VCVALNYRLSPKATFPDHLVDVKRALAWVKEHIAEYGGNPDFVVITGGSAGGHLCSLAALTPNDPEYQPGFEDVDTSVQACVPFYGVYDFTNRKGVGRGDMRIFLERVVVKASLERDRDAFDRASPMSRITADAPPMFVIHGANDTLVPVAEARLFVELLRETSRAPVVYAELPMAQHAFEVFPSMRTYHVVGAVERFVAVVYSDWLRATGAVEAPERATAR
jgi:acetyl esterase/lipase